MDDLSVNLSLQPGQKKKKKIHLIPDSISQRKEKSKKHNNYHFPSSQVGLAYTLTGLMKKEKCMRSKDELCLHVCLDGQS